MAKSSIAEFFQQKAKATKPPRDWTAKKKEFVNKVDALYETIEKEYLKDAGAVVDYRVTTVREPDVGRYRARKMTVRVGDEQVVFTPKGINIYGAAGRVDVQGECGDGMLVLQRGGRWGIVLSMTPNLRVVPLRTDTFLDLLRDVMLP